MTAPTDFIEIPSGALCGEVIPLTCKGPDEERSYVIEYSQQLDPDDYISPTGITWVAGDNALTVTNITSHGRRFRFTLNGGTLNQKSGLTFTIPLISGDIREITFALTVQSQGVLQSGTVPVIMGAQGSRGSFTWAYNGDSPPPANWQPTNNSIRTGDFVLVTGTHEIFEATVNQDGSVSYELVVDLGAASTINTDTEIKKTDGTVIETIGSVQAKADGAMQDGNYLTVLGGAVVARPSVTGTIPADFTVNGNVYIAPASYTSNPSSLPAGLSVDTDTGIVLTDGSVFFPNTINNIGVLCAASE